MAKRALLVGINAYADAPLSGCVNDVINMRSLLKDQYGFQNTDIRVLLDARAKSAEIRKRLESLVAATKPGDTLLFHYSGHGSNVRDRDGDELRDRLDEIICPYDLDWNNPDSYLTDDDLRVIFNKVPAGALVEVIMDCCHSGTIMRSAGNTLLDGRGSVVVSRYLQPPLDILLRSEGDELKTRTFRQRGVVESPSNKVLWAGCKSNQTSADAEFKGVYNGALTYVLTSILREAPKIARVEVMRRLRSKLRLAGFSQIPQLEADATKSGAGSDVDAPFLTLGKGKM